MSNYSRNIDALAPHFRVIVPDMPGYGRSDKHIDHSDPYGYLADTIRGLLDALDIDTAHLIGNSYGGAAALRLALDTPRRVDKLVLMGPVGVGTTRAVPTAGIRSLLSYYGGEGPSRDKLAAFIRTYLVYDGALVPDDLIELRYQASIDPEVVANPPARMPSGPTALRTLWRTDFTRDSRLKTLQTPTLVLWGRDDKVNRPAGGPMLLNAMPNAELVMTSHTGHWMQWERAEPVQRTCHRIPQPRFETRAWLTSSATCTWATWSSRPTNSRDWRRFGRDAIGMHLDETLPDVMRFRLDDNECRFLLQRGPAEDVTTLGWQLDDHATFDEVVSRVTRHGVPVTEGTDEEAALRGVERLVRFPGPNGLAQEIFTRADTSDTPLDMRVGGGFVTGEFGMGHVAITTKKPHQMRGYYDTVFDARLSDYIDETISGVKLKIRFLRVNERHHSVAIAAVNRLPVNPIRTRIQHLNIQVADLDDMTASYQRVKELGFDMALGVGQHTNDKELSYYAVTPSGFEWEVGWNPIVVDEKHLGADDVSRHQHLGPHPAGTDHHRQARPVQDRRPVTGAP